MCFGKKSAHFFEIILGIMRVRNVYNLLFYERKFPELKWSMYQ
jgi:hypothetical protein